MITCKFFGGLGNNLFQLAQVYAIHKLYNIELVIPSFTDRNIIPTLKLDQEINLEFSKLFENEFKYTNTPIIGLHEYSHADCDRPLDDKIYHYSEVPLYDNMCYKGYFQSDKYFLGVDMSKEFVLKKDNIEQSISKYPQFFLQKEKQNIAIHYRLGGDRVSPHMQNVYPPVSTDFYIKAIESLGDYTPEKYNILVFSDNLDLCKDIMKNFPYPVTFISKQSNILDFTMISLCEINIIGNSTFGWWAAYMNQNPNKKVLVTESEWFGPDLKNKFSLKDVFPDTWVRFILDKNGNYITK